MEERRGNKQEKNSQALQPHLYRIYFFPHNIDDFLISFSLSEQCHTDPAVSPGHSGAHSSLLGEIRPSPGGDRGWPGVLCLHTEQA